MKITISLCNPTRPENEHFVADSLPVCCQFVVKPVAGSVAGLLPVCCRFFFIVADSLPVCCQFVVGLLPLCCWFVAGSVATLLIIFSTGIDMILAGEEGTSLSGLSSVAMLGGVRSTFVCPRTCSYFPLVFLRMSSKPGIDQSSLCLWLRGLCFFPRIDSEHFFCKLVYVFPDRSLFREFKDRL